MDDAMIKHYADYDEFNIQIGDNVEMYVDKENRLKNAKNHTAGHLISMIVEDLNLGLEAIKGYHFNQGSYVEFKGQKPQNKEEITEKINDILKDNINHKLPVSVIDIHENEMKDKYGINTEHINSDTIRAIIIGNYKPIPCGGTHIKSLDELEQITVTKIKTKKDNIRFSYIVS
jgi:Ser-tRNA(Ala) deacylase AlaX